MRAGGKETSSSGLDVTMLLENEPYPQDVRVRAEAEALAVAGHRVTVVAPRAGGQPRSEIVNGVLVRRYRLPQAHGGVLGFLLEYVVAHGQLLVRALRALASGTHVVHLHNPPDTLFPIGLAARALGRRFVFDSHDLFPELVAAKFPSPLLTRLASAAQRAALRSASAVIVTNQSQREIAERRGAVAVSVLRNGPPRASLASVALPRPEALPAPRLVFVGALGPQDGVLDLPDLMSEPGLTRALLTVVGDGPCLEPLAAEVARRPSLSSRVTLTGRVEHRRVPELLAQADIAIDPAPCTPFNHLSTMVKIAEYLAAGLPVVAYGLLETRRTAGDAALYARCGDRRDFARAVARLAREPELRSRLAARGRRRAEDLVWERSEEALLALYRRFAREVARG